MGFDNRASNGKPTFFMKIKSEKDASNVITGKFFSLSKKVDGNWVDELQKSNDYPTPFYGFLKDIKLELDKKIKKKDGTEIPLPTIKFYFYDENANYILDLVFSNDKGRVTGDVFGLLNTMASIDKFGLLKLYIVETEKNGRKDFSLNIRNAKDWAEGSDKSVFQAPKDKTQHDPTRVGWKYKYDDIPKHTIEKEIDGEMVTIVQEKKHKEFFVKMVTDIILPKLAQAVVDDEPGVSVDDLPDSDSDDLPF